MTDKHRKQSNYEEAQLLASVGLRVADTDAYEDSVIREATHEAAPKLGGVGFQDLSALLPGKSVSRQDQQRMGQAISNLIEKIREQLKDKSPGDESQQANVMRLKLQMLLTLSRNYLPSSNTSVSDSKWEISTDKKRSAILKAKHERNTKRSVQLDEEGQSVNHDNKRLHGKPEKNSTVSYMRQSALTPAERLDQAKLGLLSTVTEEDEDWKIRYLRQRDEASANFDRLREMRRQRREERSKRREQELAFQAEIEKRPPQDDQDDKQSESSNINSLGDSPQAETQIEGETIFPVQHNDNDILPDEESNVVSGDKRPLPESHDGELAENSPYDNLREQTDSAAIEDNIVSVQKNFKEVANEVEPAVDGEHMATPRVEPSSVVCPICKIKIDVRADTMHADEVLAAHVQQCERQLNRRRSTRSRRTNLRYTEPNDEDFDYDTKDVKPKRKLPNTSQKYSRKKPAKMAEDLDFVCTNRSEEESNQSEQDEKEVISVKSSLKLSTHAKPILNRIMSARRTKGEARDDLELLEYEDRVDDWIESGISKMRHMNEQDQQEAPPGKAIFPGGLVIPAWAYNRLFPYQRAGVRWMWELHLQGCGGIVGDEMGLGKSVQVASYLGAMAACRKLDSVLIICPATMLDHWLRELSVWAPGLRRIMIHKSGENDGFSRSVSHAMLNSLAKWLKQARSEFRHEPLGDDDKEDEDTFCGTGYVIVTTFEGIRRNADIWINHSWSYVLMDEGQKIKNPDADVTLACKRLRTPHRLLLSGTPIQNDLRELWSLFDFVMPSRLGTLPSFETEFSEPIRKGGYSNASAMQVQLAYKCALVLRDIINPYMLRRLKRDIAEVNRMPGKKEQVLFCRLSDQQRMLYESYLQSEEVKAVIRGSNQSFRAITHLRKICNHPSLVSEKSNVSFDSLIQSGKSLEEIITSDCSDEEESENYKSIESSGKLSVLSKILPLWHKQGHRVLIFCQWKKMLNIIQLFMLEKGWRVGRLDGSTNVGSRQQLVDTFNNDESYFAMLMTTRTGGVGLNLTGANRVVLYDPDWNPQTDAQARERAFRFGQEREVTIYRMITAGTIEEKIYHRQIFKTALSDKILHDPQQRRLFSQKDLKDLFTLKDKNDDHVKIDTGALTKGKGMRAPEEIEHESRGDVDQDNCGGNAFGTILKSKGLAAVFDHDFIDSNAQRKFGVAKEMEEEAEKAARRAQKALHKSTAEASIFEPTWTGSSETHPSRQHFGDSSTPGILSSSTPKSSLSILATLKQRQKT